MDIQTVSSYDFATQGFASLTHIPDPPPILWTRGTPHPPDTKRLTVVGSRNLSAYGREACQLLIRSLAGYPISIISGLAFGADACAHKAALAAGLHTIAIPGSGLADSAIAPRSNRGLAHEILHAGGLLLSEHPPETVAHPRFFPSRNRIMVGLADAVLMIEAGPQSGTLITARLAGEYGRDLLCIPHRIGDPHGTGSHVFLRIGATMVSESTHILEALGIQQHHCDTLPPLPMLSVVEQTIYALLATPQTRDALIRASGLPVGTTLAALANLEIQGVAIEQFGMWHRTHPPPIPDPKLDHI